MHDADAGSSPWGSVERLQALANLLCIAGGESVLLDALQPAVHGWLTLGASGGTHDPDMRQRHLILGMLPFIVLPILSISSSALIANTMIQFCASYLHIIVLMRLTLACHDCRTLPGYLHVFHHLKGLCINEQMCLQVLWMRTMPARQPWLPEQLHRAPRGLCLIAAACHRTL